MKPVKYTCHARQRMELRGITEAMVEETIEHPERTGVGYLGRELAYRTYPAGVLKVVYSEKADRFAVITTIWE